MVVVQVLIPPMPDTDEGSRAKDDGVPRFNVLMILMQSVLVPEYLNTPDHK